MTQAETTAVDYQKARHWGLQVLDKVGLYPEEALIFINALIEANLRGVDTHGLNYLPVYIKRMEMGLIDKVGQIKTLRESASYALLDGGNAVGHVAAHRAMTKAVKMAKSSGVGVVGVNNSNHCGVMAIYTLMAAEANCIGLGMTNAPASMAPWGGREAFFGTNPISIAVPGGMEPPIVLDMATSEVARAKVVMAGRRGESIPLDWALDEQGRPTGDAEAALKGTMVPMSGHKGYGLALMVDLIAGILTGAASAREVGPLLFGDGTNKQKVGIYFQAIDVDHMVPFADFSSRVDRLIQQIRSSSAAPGTDSIRLPGDGGRRTAEIRRREGIPLSAYVLEELNKLGKKYAVPWPYPG